MPTKGRKKSNRAHCQTPKIKSTKPKPKPKESKDLQTTEDVNLIDIDIEVPSQLINITMDNNEEEERRESGIRQKKIVRNGKFLRSFTNYQ